MSGKSTLIRCLNRMNDLVPGRRVDGDVIVTHNLQQAGRVADLAAFLTAENEIDALVGRLVEFGPTEQIFSDPTDPRTEAYVTGRFG